MKNADSIFSTPVFTMHIKPVSVNECFRGRRFKTPKYDSYVKALQWMLPSITLPAPPFEVHYTFGFSSAGSDIDNCIKTTTDSLCAKYKFNDNQIYKLVIEKEIVQKGQEYFNFQISSYIKP